MLNKILNSNSICAKGAIVLGLIVGTLCSSLQTASAGPDTCQEPPSIVKIDPQELLDAIRKVETGGEPNRGIGAVGDNGKAIGPFQIHKDFHTDAVQQDKKNKIKILGREPDYQRCLTDYKYSEKVTLLYMQRYSSKEMKSFADKGYLTLDEAENIARRHNGGPRGHNKKATKPYWAKVKKQLLPKKSSAEV